MADRKTANLMLRIQPTLKQTLRELFPELVTEGPDGVAVNLDVLKQLVGDQTVTDAEEKYGLNWHGKRRARQLALTPSTGTLRPCPEDSVDWDTTQNLMIEGDNLEVLKLLQKSYAGKVKLIYIDPPYNTGKDFVYPDNFQDNIKNYLELTGQTGERREETLMSSNTEAPASAFHTDWLNMMYPRCSSWRASASSSWPAATSGRGSRTATNLAETLEASIEHLKTDRTEQDILFELLLKLGLDLCVPIETKKHRRSQEAGACPRHRRRLAARLPLEEDPAGRRGAAGPRHRGPGTRN
jgi:hypothetical protein